jgi:hypothetical protein
MNRTRRASSGAPGIASVVCQTHARPVYVPWHQHAVGCPVRAVELQRRQLELRPPLRIVSNIAAF